MADAEPCAQLLRQLQAPYGLWAVMGNHDCFTDPDRVTAALHSQGIPVLVNQSVPIERDGARFWLSGVGDVLGDDADLDATLHPSSTGEPTILLAHEPDFADSSLDTRGPATSGHTHGGQVRPPFLRHLFAGVGQEVHWGPYKIGSLTLYTNLGLGTVGVPVGWNCPPEITLLTMRRSAS